MQVTRLAPGMQPISGQAPSGAPVRGYVIRPDQVELGAVTARTAGDPRLVAAVNANFFTRDGSVGDLKGPGLLELDQGARDRASDKRHFLAFTARGVREGTGGYETLTKALPPHQIKGFIGGLGRLFDAQESRTLQQDVANGRFQARLDQAIKAGSFPNIGVQAQAARSVVGITQDGRVLMLTIGEGRQRGYGANLAQAALILKQHGAVTGYCLDGGGSTHWLNQTASDGRRVVSYLGVFRSEP